MLVRDRRTHRCVILYYLSTEHKFCVALKGQTTAEIFTCTEIVVLRTTAEMVEGPRYKLRVLGAPTDVHWMYFVITPGLFPAHPDQKTLL